LKNAKRQTIFYKFYLNILPCIIYRAHFFMIYFIPSNINLLEITEMCKIRCKNCTEKKLIKIVDLILITQYYNHYFENNSKRIHSDKFKKITPYYPYYIKVLREQGIIVVNDHYIVDKQSKSYSFTPKYTTLTVSKDIKEEEEDGLNGGDEEDNGWVEEKEGILFFRKEKWYDTLCKHLVFVDFDSENALKYLESTFTSGDVYEERLRRQMEELNIRKIKEGNFNPHRDKNIRRFHTPLTNLKSEYRNFLTIRGKEIVCLDLKNSQPFLALKLFDPSFWYSPNLSKYQLRRFKKLFPNVIIEPDTMNFHFLGYDTNILKTDKYYRILDAIKNVQSDLHIYFEKVQNGSLYYLIQEELKTQLGKEISDYRELKGVIFTILFSSNRTGYISEKGKNKTEYIKLFKKLFPSVYSHFYAIKVNEHNLLSTMLQRLESYIFIDTISKKIIEEKASLPFFTIHDSIACTLDQENYIHGIISTEIEKIIGFVPTIGIEKWHPSNLEPK